MSNQRPRSCHKCPLNGKGDERCIECPGPAEESYAGISYVHLGGLESPEEFVQANRLQTLVPEPSMQGRQGCVADSARSVTKELAPDVERALVVILASLMSMDDQNMVIFRHLYHGDDYVQTAKAVGLSVEGVRKRVIELARRNRIVTHVVNVMKRKGIGGAKRGRRRNGTIQLDMFHDVLA